MPRAFNHLLHAALSVLLAHPDIHLNFCFLLLDHHFLLPVLVFLQFASLLRLKLKLGVSNFLLLIKALLSGFFLLT